MMLPWGQHFMLFERTEQGTLSRKPAFQCSDGTPSHSRRFPSITIAPALG